MRKVRFAALAVLAVGAAYLPATAHAWWRGGVWVGVPFSYVAPPPVYYAPPPVVYAPPPVVYDPNAPQPGYQQPQVASAGSCAAGAYICPLDQPLQPGSPCSCPANRGRVSGYAR
jgi:hypothetical protein